MGGRQQPHPSIVKPTWSQHLTNHVELQIKWKKKYLHTLSSFQNCPPHTGKCNRTYFTPWLCGRPHPCYNILHFFFLFHRTVGNGLPLGSTRRNAPDTCRRVNFLKKDSRWKLEWWWWWWHRMSGVSCERRKNRWRKECKSVREENT